MSVDTVAGPSIWGVGTSDFGRHSGQRIEQLAWTAALEAIDDAGIDPADIDALIVGSVFGPVGVAARVQRGLGLRHIPVLRVEAACASGTAALHEAAVAVESGRYRCVLALGVEQLSYLGGGALKPQPTDPEGAAGLPLPGIYALAASRYLHDYGATAEQLAAVAVKNKANGQLNDRALFRGAAPTLAEVLAAPMIADPLTRLQCCPTTDGAAAAVIGPAPRRSGDVRILASALTSGEVWGSASTTAWTSATIARAGRAALSLAGLDPAAIDVLEVHDAFTIGEILTLEALGFCAPGEGAQLAVDGHSSLRGPQPVNPSGGLLSRGHPLGATGLAQTAEIVWQLRGEAGPRQVKAQRGLVETMGAGAGGFDGNVCVVTVLEKQ